MLIFKIGQCRKGWNWFLGIYISLNNHPQLGHNSWWKGKNVLVWIYHLCWGIFIWVRFIILHCYFWMYLNTTLKSHYRISTSYCKFQTRRWVDSTQWPSSPPLCQRRGWWTRRSLSSPGPRRRRAGFERAFERSSARSASPSLWGSRTRLPEPTSPPPVGIHRYTHDKTYRRQYEHQHIHIKTGPYIFGHRHDLLLF